MGALGDRPGCRAGRGLCRGVGDGDGGAWWRRHDAGDGARRHYGDEFCNTWIVIEQAFADTPDDPAEMAEWYAENGAPLVAEIREYAPEQIAEPVNAYMDAAEQFGTTGDFNVLFIEEFSDAAAAIYPTFEEGCGIPVVEALLTDYAFGGIPETLASGPTAFVVHNNSEAGEAHEMLLIRVNDDVDLTAEELLALPEEELPDNATFVNAAFTPAADTTAGVVVNLTPGRYVYVCFVAEGSVDGAEGTGPPHFMHRHARRVHRRLMHLKVNSCARERCNWQR